MPSYRDGSTQDGTSQEGTSLAPFQGKNGKVFTSIGLKVIVAVALTVCSMTICFTVAFLSLKWDTHQFHQAFSADANKLLAHIGSQGEKNLETMAALGTSVTSASISQASTWPFVTIPAFASLAAHTLESLNTSRVFLSPSVSTFNRLAWEDYSNEHQKWSETRVAPLIFKVADNGTKIADVKPPFHPVWQMVPPNSYDIKFNMDSIPSLANALEDVHVSKEAIITAPLPGGEEEGNILEHLDVFSVVDQQEEEPVSIMLFPVFDTFHEETRTVVGVLVAPFLWKSYLLDALAEDTKGVLAVLTSCGQTYSYQVRENKASFLGRGDHHHPYYDEDKHSGSLNSLLHQAGFAKTADGTTFNGDYECQYKLDIYPTPAYQNQVNTKVPLVSTIVVVVLAAVLFLSFLAYGESTDAQLIVLKKEAEKTASVVDTFFPKDVQDRLFRKAALDIDPDFQFDVFDDDPLSKLKAFLDHSEIGGSTSAPIADLWPNCTVLFLDIVGFTAWSGCREPVQVFTLLETLFKAFDEQCNKRGAFKVETVGDCYVAVCGLPIPRKNHAVVMSRFAQDCITLMPVKTRELEVKLGPDTADLTIRVGLNSGPVTAGVIRSEKGRFQLFGDTVNVSARIESSGKPNQIHCSESTAELLKEAGKDTWLVPRKDRVEAKGKGLLKTFWIYPNGVRNMESSQVLPSGCGTMEDKTSRLVDWNVQVFAKILTQIVTRRETPTYHRPSRIKPQRREPEQAPLASFLVDEVLDVVEVSTPPSLQNISTQELDTVVLEQLREFISRIASLYHENPFHNFEHASHVVMNSTKMLSRIAAPTASDRMRNGVSLDDNSYGLVDHPLTHFAICFGALIHDADHPGVSNNQLVSEGSALAAKYENRSVAEQNSLEISLELLQDPLFGELFSTICATSEEATRFRSLVVNTVMATDIMDKELKAHRDSRWEKAFQKGDSSLETRNAKSTVVLETLIQASDVVHTMQHWHVYRKWNERLFLEMYKAYKEGRGSDPSVGWAKGELGFYDFYIIPLAEKLNECGVFGVSGDEFLNYAKANRAEWEQKGETIVAEMLEKLKEPDVTC